MAMPSFADPLPFDDGAGEGPDPSDDPNEPVQAGKPTAGLYVVATPIGNLGDITLRALDMLKGADLIACEDTRVTGRLLARYAIRTRLTPYHEHNAAEARPRLLEAVAGGSAVALVSDAGTPLISDPGYRLVREALDRGLAVHHLPGASALLPALVLSGLPTDRFHFAGFLPPRPAARQRALADLAAIEATLVLYEAPQRLADLLADAADQLGAQRPAAVARELTKLFEEVRRGTVGELAARYGTAGPPKGEVVVVIGAPVAREADQAAASAEVDSLLAGALKRGESVRDAAATVAAATGQPRKTVYARALALARDREEGDADPST